MAYCGISETIDQGLVKRLDLNNVSMRRIQYVRRWMEALRVRAKSTRPRTNFLGIQNIEFLDRHSEKSV